MNAQPVFAASPAAPAVTRARAGGRVVVAASIYFALVFVVGMTLGPIRVLWLEPWLGGAIAVLCETPFLLLAMALAGRLAPRLARLPGSVAGLLGVGLLALAFQEIADLAVGFGLRGMTFSQQLALFATPPGWIYIGDLIAFALAPLVMRRRASGRAPAERSTARS